MNLIIILFSELMALIIFIWIRYESVYFRWHKIKDAIAEYNKSGQAQIKLPIFIENRHVTAWRIWDWDCENMISVEIYDKIKKYLLEDLELEN